LKNSFVHGFMNINSSVHPYYKEKNIHIAGKVHFNALAYMTKIAN